MVLIHEMFNTLLHLLICLSHVLVCFVLIHWQLRLFHFNGWFVFLYLISIVISHCLFVWRNGSWRKPFVHTNVYFNILVCINVMHGAYMITITSICFTYCIELKCPISYMHVLRGASLEVSSMFILNNSMSFVIIKRGRLLTQRHFTLVFMMIISWN